LNHYLRSHCKYNTCSWQLFNCIAVAVIQNWQHGFNEGQPVPHLILTTAIF
jgi:hypothetical protein